MDTKNKMSEDYFHGIGELVAKATGYTSKYVRDVLNGRWEGRNTKAVKKIKNTADLFMTPVKDAEILQSA